MDRPYRVSAVQWSLSPSEYIDDEAFFQAVRRRCAHAVQPEGTSLIVFPELSGIWMQFSRLVPGNAEGKLKALFQLARTSPRTLLALMFRKGASVLAEDDHPGRWLAPFSACAAEFGVYICPGSAFIKGDDRRVRNTSCLISPEGEVLGYRSKIHLTVSEKKLGAVPGDYDTDLEPIGTPWGNTGIAICLDGFYDDVVRELDRRETVLVLQPSANSIDWNSPVSSKEGKIPQHVQWLKTGIGHLIQGRRYIQTAVNPMDATRHPLLKNSGCSSIWRNCSGTLQGPEQLAPDPYGECILSAVINGECQE